MIKAIRLKLSHTMVTVAFLCSHAYASLLATPAWELEYDPGSYSYGYSLQILDAGTSISKFKLNQESSSSKHESIEETFKSWRKSHETQMSVLKAERERIYDEFKNLNFSDTPTDDLSQRGSTQGESNEFEGMELVYDRNQLIECARQVKMDIQRLIRMEKQTVETVRDRRILKLKILQLKQKIRETRGNGIQSGMQGVACGKFLGSGGFLSEDEIQDIKFLTVFLSRTGDELNQLIITAIAAFHRDGKPAVTRVWRQYWDILSLESVFKSSPLSTWKQLEERMRQLVFETGEFGRIPIAPEELEELTRIGVQFGESFLKNHSSNENPDSQEGEET